MEECNIYQDISERTNGDIYIGVVGPVRTGKSTFIKKLMGTVVAPNMDENSRHSRTINKMPQSTTDCTIMTTRLKLIPEQAVTVNTDDSAAFRVRMIDCVGYIVPSALGYTENGLPRVICTPWYNEPIPFNMAAEIDTRKIIIEHSIIRLLIATDGSVSEILREEYEKAEKHVVSELKEIEKPLIVLPNCTNPTTPRSRVLAENMQKRYKVPMQPASCLELNEKEIRGVPAKVLFEFPVRGIKVEMPHRLSTLERKHWLRSAISQIIQQSASKISRIRETEGLTDGVSKCEYVGSTQTLSVDLGISCVRIGIQLKTDLLYRIFGEQTRLELHNEGEPLPFVLELAKIRMEYDKIRDAYQDVLDIGYGVMIPTVDEISLEEPEIIRQGGEYGVRLRAAAPSVHLIHTKITTELAPTVGSEQQPEEPVMSMMKGFEGSPVKIWESNIFGEPLHKLVNKEMHDKLYRVPADAHDKMKKMIERIISDGHNGLICIIPQHNAISLLHRK